MTVPCVRDDTITAASCGQADAIFSMTEYMCDVRGTRDSTIMLEMLGCVGHFVSVLRPDLTVKCHPSRFTVR